MVRAYLTIACVLGSLALAAQDTKHELSLEIDPAPFILDGYSFSLKWGSASLPKTAIMGSVYCSRFPDKMMSQTNRDKGWADMQFETSYALFIEQYLTDERKGLYFGPSVFLYHKSVEMERASERIDFYSIYPNLRVGYRWFPFKNANLYINPWFNIGSEISLDDANQLNGASFEPGKLSYIMALHIGYRLRW